ncbi:MAG: A/G-specific adenine glycosylase [Actinomycetota bacterium]|nr:A/G-specific adenine glycosylase [Actinomycetota bacterium]
MTRAIVRGRASLLEWYRPRARAYPWRGSRDPYRVLVSEVMLQQTQAARVVPAYRSFVRRFPTVRALAAAPRSDVIVAWGSLGYPRRALALGEAARVIVRDHDGVVPRDLAALQGLPGIGPYTAAAVASLGYGTAVSALDTNVRRVVGRVLLGRDDAPSNEVRVASDRWLDRREPASWNQALMDVGRAHCRTKPRCDGCPLARACEFRRSGAVPIRSPRRQPRYEGSVRQLRGAIIRTLRSTPSTSIEVVVRGTGRSRSEVVAAVLALHDEGIVAASPAALAGAPRGRVRLSR